MPPKIFVTSRGAEITLWESLGNWTNTYTYRLAEKVIKIVTNDLGIDFSIFFERLKGKHGIPLDFTTFVREIIESFGTCWYNIPDMTEFSAGFWSFQNEWDGQIFYYTQPFIRWLTDNDRSPENSYLPIPDACDTWALKEVKEGGETKLILLDWDKLLLACLMYARDNTYDVLLSTIRMHKR